MNYVVRTTLLAMFVALAIAPSAAGEALDFTRVDPVVELRGVWIDASAIPKTDRGVRELVRAYHCAGLNILFPEMIARGYAVYPSGILARDPRFAGAIDPLPAMIDEAHKQGMEVHPWVWVFRAGYSKDRGAILCEHPDWVELGKDGKDLSPNGGLWVSPAIPAARDFLAGFFEELVRCYDIDGLHLDYVRYEPEHEMPYGYCDASRSAFTEQYGIDPIEADQTAIGRYEWHEFRERLVNTFVQRIALQTRSIRPRVKISAAVGAIPDEARSRLLQNWGNWVDNKWVDFLTPMTYTTDDPHMAKMIEREIGAVCDRTLLAPGVGVQAFKKEPEKMVRQIGVAREAGTVGQVLFSASYLKPEHIAALVDGPYRCPALLTIRDPVGSSAVLRVRALGLAAEGRQDEASWFFNQALRLERYVEYREAWTGYVRPTPPPIADSP